MTFRAWTRCENAEAIVVPQGSRVMARDRGTPERHG